MRIAFSLFWSWLFSSWQVTTRPDGLCVMRTAESVVLTDCPPGPLDRYTSISRSLGSTCDVDLLGLGQHRHRGRAGVDAALALGGRARAARGAGPASCLSRDQASSPFTTKVTSRTPPMSDSWLAQHLDLPAVEVGVALVHLEEVGGPEVALLAALAAADLDDHVLAVVGVLGDEQLAQPARRARRAAPPSPRPPRPRYSRISASDSPLEHLAGVGEVGLGGAVRPVRLDDRLQLRVATAGVARGGLVAGGVDLRQTSTRASPARSRAPPGVRTRPSG